MVKRFAGHVRGDASVPSLPSNVSPSPAGVSRATSEKAERLQMKRSLGSLRIIQPRCPAWICPPDQGSTRSL
eukprot:5308048-Pyramimonas_sp.AAC.4